MPLHDASYQHWEGAHLGLWHRRLAIARNGLTSCLRNKWLRHLVVTCWIASLSATALIFFAGQLLVADSFVFRAMGNMGAAWGAFATTLAAWLGQHPEISVRTTQDVLFYYFGIYLMVVSIFALGLALPDLITRDLASNAIIIYASKAVSRGDYLLGKFATAFGVMAMTWLGPVCTAWFMGNLLGPDWRFFWHARAALGHVLVYGLSSTVVLSLLVMGASAVSSKEKSTTALWFSWWVVGFVVGQIAIYTKPWLRHVSFNYDLDQIALSVFRLGDDLKTAQDNIPVLGNILRRVRPETLSALNEPAIWGSLVALALMMVGAAWVVHRRVKPE